MLLSHQAGRRLPWLMLIVGSILFLTGIAFLIAPVFELGIELWGLIGTPWIFINGDPLTGKSYLANVALYVGAFLLAQWLFLQPKRLFTLRLVQHGRPMTASIIAAAFIAMLLSVAFLTTLLEIFNLWERVANYHLFWGIMAGFWIFWGAIFYIYWRQGDRYTQLGRMTRGLLAGSILELFIAVPVQIVSPNRDTCYCAPGSYTGLVFGGTVLIWCFGPGVVLLFYRERYRRMKFQEQLCLSCGYDLRGTVAAGRTSCPECGKTIEQPTDQ